MEQQIILSSNGKQYYFNLNDLYLVNEFAPGTKFAKSNTYDPSTATYKTTSIQSAISNNKLSAIAALDGAFIDWDNVQVSINDQLYNINSTADLLNIIEETGKVDSSFNLTSNNAIKNKVVTQEFSDLEAAIASLAYIAAENMSNLD